MSAFLKIFSILVLFLVVSVSGCSEPVKEVTGSTSDKRFELTLRADLNWVRFNSTLLVQLSVRRLDPTAELNFTDRVSFVANNGSIVPNSVTPSFEPAPGDTVDQEVFQTWLEYRAPGLSYGGPVGEKEGQIHAVFRDVRASLNLRIVPNLND